MPDAKNPRLLLLTVKIGAGHWMAATAVATAWERETGGQALVVDPFEQAQPWLKKLIFDSYLAMLAHQPHFYQFIYTRTEISPGSWFRQGGDLLLYHGLKPPLQQIISDFDPVAILATHPFPLAVLAKGRQKGWYQGLLTAALTDFALHAYWVSWPTDCFFVPHHRTGQALTASGVPPEQVEVSGLPISPAFQNLPSPVVARRQLGLTEQLPVILVMGGGLGLGPQLEVLRSIRQQADDEWQIIAVAGNNLQLRTKAEQILVGHSRSRVLGFTDQIPLLMAAADLLVTKPGGVTAAEATAAGLPLVLVDPLPGQEERNAAFLQEETGVSITKAAAVGAVIAELFSDRSRLNQISAKMAELGRPDAAYRIVRKIQTLLN